MPNGSFTGRTVLVFGAAGALGAGVAAAFGAAGAAVIGVDRAVPDAGRQLDGVRYEAADVLDDAALGAFFGAAPAPWAVVNTVGGFAPRGPLADLDPAELTGQLQLNLVSAALITKHALRVLQAAGEGRIVHTASRAAVVTKGAGFPYSVSKAGVLHLVTMAADEVAGSAITVNCVVPNFVVYRHVGSRAFRPRLARLALYCRIDSNQGQGGAAARHRVRRSPRRALA